MRLLILSSLLVSTLALVGCSSTDDSTPQTHAYSQNVPQPQPQPTPGPTTKLPIPSTPERCGFDFPDETDPQQLEQITAALEGSWEEKNGATNRDVANDTFTRRGFSFDISGKKLGFTEFTYDYGANTSPRPGTATAQQFERHTWPRLDARRLRISQPVTDVLFAGTRFLSVFDAISAQCWTVSIKFKTESEIELSNPVMTTGPLGEVMMYRFASHTFEHIN